MKLKNVKNGQRVVLKVDTGYPKAGDEGTIVIRGKHEVDRYVVAVHFDRDVGGWSDSDYNIPYGHGWGCDIKDLKRLK